MTESRRLVPASASPGEAIRLLDDFVRHAEAEGPYWGPETGRRQIERVRDGTFLGDLWIGPGDEAVAVVWGDPPSEVGRRVALHLGPGFRTKAGFDSLLRELSPGGAEAPPLVEVKEFLYGMATADATAVLHAHGFVRVSRSDLHWPVGKAPPVTPIPDGTRQVRAGDVGGLAVLLERAYSTNPIDIALFRERRDLAADCRGAAERILGGEFGPSLPDASFVVERDGRLIAAVLANVLDGALLSEVMVDPAYRKQGLAGALLVRSIVALQTTGHPEIRLVVTDSNEIARRLYLGLGFEPVPGSTGATWLHAAALGLSASTA